MQRPSRRCRPRPSTPRCTTNAYARWQRKIPRDSWRGRYIRVCLRAPLPNLIDTHATQKTRNESIMAGGEGAMVWLVAQLPDSHDIAAVARWERIDDACASALEPVTAVPFGGPEQIRFFDELGPMHRRIMGSRPHYCAYRDAMSCHT